MTIDGIQKSVKMIDGTGQGTILGPLLCNLFFLPILELWCKDMEHLAPSMLSENEVKLSTFLSNFADDSAMMAGNENDMKLIVQRFPSYLSDFGVNVHTSELNNEKSKSSVIHIPATNEQAEKCTQHPVDIVNTKDNTVSKKQERTLSVRGRRSWWW